MAVPAIFNTIEQTTFSTWLRESPSLFAFYFVLLFHTVGLAMLVGANAVLDLRILGVASALPLKPFKSLFGVMWTGLGINVASGLLLLTAYPTKALTNPFFYLKLTFIGLAVVVLVKIHRRVFGDASLSETAMIANGRMLAKYSLALWIAAIVVGRLLSETAKYLLYGTLNAG